MRFWRSGQNDRCWPLKAYRNSGRSSVKKLVLTGNLFLVVGNKKCYLLAIVLNMIIIWGFLKFCWFMLHFDKYECYNLPHVTTCPRSPLL